MRFRLQALLLTALLLAGCAGRPSAPPVPAPPVPLPPAETKAESPPPPPLSPAPVSLRKLEPREVLGVNVVETASNKRMQLPMKDNAPLIEALVNALNAAGEGRLRNDHPDTSLAVTILLRTGDGPTLFLLTGTDAVAGVWDQMFYIKDAGVTQALAALAAGIAKVPPEQPGTQLWAFDPSGQRAREILLDNPDQLWVAGQSPDGRYFLLDRSLGDYKGDYRAIPFLWDRTTGKLTQGKETLVRFAQWSGHGFFINTVAHLDLDMHETRLDGLATALGDRSASVDLPSIAFTPDGKRFAVLVNGEGPMGTVDLVIGNVDGTGIVRVPHAGFGDIGQLGTIAFLTLSPDGKYAAISDKNGTRIAPVAEPDPGKWLSVRGQGYAMVWAPDSRHLFVGNGSVVDLAGKATPVPNAGYGLVWRPDGQGGVVYGSDVTHLFTLDGKDDPLLLPSGAMPVAFLPDGRLLIWHQVRR